jgi:hypothetical protein
VGFSIGNKGYIGTGHIYPAPGYNDFWEFDPAGNNWTQKSDFSGGPRSIAVGFSIGTKGYLGAGSDSSGTRNDFWEWDQLLDTWSQKANLPGATRVAAIGLSINGRGYIGTGFHVDSMGIGHELNDFWEYDTASNTWSQKANILYGGIDGGIGFSLNGKGYICTGNYIFNFMEFDPAFNVWNNKADLGSTDRFMAIGFSIGNHGYITTGEYLFPPIVYLNDLWEYSPDTASAINELESNVSIFPIPLTPDRLLYVNFKSPLSNCTLNIYDSGGHRIKQFQISGTFQQIDLESVSAGVYFAEVRRESFSYIKKIIVE